MALSSDERRTADGGRATPDGPADFDDLSLDRLRLRRSAKWVTHPDDVLPAWVAELDFELAPPVRDALRSAVELDDAGYANRGRLPEAFAAFAAGRLGWTVEPARVSLVADVMSGVAELLRVFTEPGDGIVINPPVYPPFFGIVGDVGRTVVEVPLTAGGDGRLDLDLAALGEAFAAGATAYLLCNPHNPTGHVLRREQLEAVAALASRYGVFVISDEIHGLMTMPGERHVPYVSLEAAGRAVTLIGASKAWNIAGLKCALIITGSDAMQDELVERLPRHVPYHVGHYGVLASVAAFEGGEPWLDGLVAQLDRNRRLLAELLADALPEVGYVPPSAGYLAWLDCRALGLGDDPAAAFLERGRVALSAGNVFGAQGAGHARLNFGTSGALLEEAVRRIAATVGR